MLNRYFNKIVCLNQPERLDRWLQFEQERKRVGFTSDQFFALEGENSFDSFCKSQKALIEKYKEYDVVLALEDDVVFQSLGQLDEAMCELPGWDIVYLGVNPKETEPYSKCLRRIKAGWTTHAIGYTKKVMEYISENYVSWEKNGMYDDWLSREVLPKFNCYAIKPMVAWQRSGYSDLWSSSVSYGWLEMEGNL